MIAIIKWELWQRRWSLMWWTLGIAAFIALNLAFYPSFRDQAAELDKAFSQIPDSAMALLSDTGDFLSPVGYLSSQIFYLLLPVILGILSISLGSSLIGREEKEGTIEVLLSRPLSRTKLLLGKAKAGIIILGIVTLSALVTTVGLSKLVKLAVPSKNIALATIASFLLALSFGAITFMITSFGRARIASIGLASLYALGGYMIASLVGTVHWLQYPAKLFPYDYYKPAEILTGTYNWNNMIFIIGISVVCGVVSWLSFSKRDITS